MKVLVIPGWYPSRYAPQNGDFVEEQAKFLKLAGIDVSVLTIDLDYRYFLNFKGFIHKYQYDIVDGVPVFRIYGGYFPKKNKYILDLWVKHFYKLYTRYEDEYGKPDLIHAHAFFGGYAAMKLGRMIGVPYIYTEHFSGILDDNWPKWQKIIYPSICENAQVVVAVSQLLADKIEKSYSCGNCRVIGNAVDTDLFVLKPILCKKRFRFIGVGALLRNKRFDLQIKAIANLRKNGLDVELVIVGEGQERKSLEKLTSSLGLDDWILFKSEIPKTAVVLEMQQADVLLLTSCVETFGIVVIEALSVGIPVIATKAAGPYDILTEKTGILVPKGDVNALSQAMEEIIINFENYEPKDLRKFVKNNYSKEVVTTKIIGLYKEVILNNNKIQING